MYRNKKVSVVISTYNEVDSIREVVDSLFNTKLVDEVVVVDNNALGNTREEVVKTKAKLITEKKQGLGWGIKAGLKEVTGDLIAMIDADGTYQSKDIEKLLAYSDEFDAVLGTRTSRSAIWSGAFMPFPVRIANLLWAKAVEFIYNGPLLTDVGCLYKLISRKALNEITPLFPNSRGDGLFNLEIIIFLLLKEVKTIEIPLIFKERVGESVYVGTSIWKAAKWGIKMIPLIIKYRFIKI